ncbi:MAG TPA: PRC-barrel domain-containing protein [Ktedonobacterales bacterium]|jgi:hypothetical protein|nr:PRC-barrel domain-containing protein [Ktedonobacterales bacterium]
MVEDESIHGAESESGPQNNPEAGSSGLEGHADAAAGRLVVGAPVYDTTGEKVGSVSAVNLPNEYFTLEKGVLFTRDFYVPLSAVERMAPDAVHLNVDKDQMAYLGWDARPNDETIDSASSLSVEDEDRQS